MDTHTAPPPASAPSHRAYVTMLAGGDAYVPGVEALGQSLLRTGSPYPRVVMFTDDVSGAAQRRLQAQGWLLRRVEHIANPCCATSQLYPRFARVFTKLRVWTLVEFDRVVFVDADTIVLRNIDALFERPGPFAAAPDFFMPDQFNSGAMVLQPSVATFLSMVDQLGRTGTYDGGDQGFLNQFFHWYQLPVEQRLPIGFNLHHFIYQFIQHHAVMRRQLGANVHIIHYTLQKPWQHRLTVMGGAELWWNMYFAAHPELDSRWRRLIHRVEDRLFEGAVGFLES